MLTAMEQEIINKVNAEVLRIKAEYGHLISEPPHEQYHIPNPFDVLTLEESHYLREHRDLLKQIETVYPKKGE